eukprot:gene29977-37121_t
MFFFIAVFVFKPSGHMPSDWELSDAVLFQQLSDAVLFRAITSDDSTPLCRLVDGMGGSDRRGVAPMCIIFDRKIKRTNK